MRYYFVLLLKGIAMGIANIIPGVSGGTIALITNIYEELILSLKSFDITSLKLLFSFKIEEFIKHTNLYFILSVFGGALISVFGIAKLLESIFESHQVLVWSFFFGLILASVYYIGLKIKVWNLKTILYFILGTLIAVSITFISKQEVENTNLIYVFLCGIVSIVGMILPGLSGSFILILMGNYELLMVSSINGLWAADMSSYILLSTFVIGSIVGLMLFSHIIAWLFKNFKDQLLSLLTGFVLGSLLIIWPWKDINVNNVTTNWYLPELNTHTIFAFILMLIGYMIVVLIEKISSKYN